MLKNRTNGREWQCTFLSLLISALYFILLFSVKNYNYIIVISMKLQVPCYYVWRKGKYIAIYFVKNKEKKKVKYIAIFYNFPLLNKTYQRPDDATIADVTLLSEGKQPPGNMYSFIKSELRLYSSYLLSGIDMNWWSKLYQLPFDFKKFKRIIIIRRRKLACKTKSPLFANTDSQQLKNSSMYSCPTASSISLQIVTYEKDFKY